MASLCYGDVDTVAPVSRPFHPGDSGLGCECERGSSQPAGPSGDLELHYPSFLQKKLRAREALLPLTRLLPPGALALCKFPEEHVHRHIFHILLKFLMYLGRGRREGRGMRG